MLIFCSKRNTFETVNWSSAVDETLKVRRGYQPSHAQPLPLWHVLLFWIHEFPQALPFLQTLQQALASSSPASFIGSKLFSSYAAAVSASSHVVDSISTVTWEGFISWSAYRSEAEMETEKIRDKHKIKTFFSITSDPSPFIPRHILRAKAGCKELSSRLSQRIPIDKNNELIRLRWLRYRDLNISHLCLDLENQRYTTKTLTTTP